MGLDLSNEERGLPLELLKAALGETRVEVRRVEAETLRRAAKHEASILRALINGLETAHAA